MGFGFHRIKAEKIPAEIKNLLAKREQARENKDWKSADEARKAIEEAGYSVEDTPDGQKLKIKI